MASKILPRAIRAAVYFDRTRGLNQWTTVIRHDDLIDIDRHRCEADARAFIGLEGGSADPNYWPALGDTACEVSIG